MPEIDLSIIANNQQLIKSVTEASKAFSDFSDDIQKNMTDSGKIFESVSEGMQEELKQLGISEQEFVNMLKKGAGQQEGILEGMQNDLRTFRQLKEKATTTEDIEKFNKKISETQKKINDLNGETKKTESGVDKLKGSFLKMFGVIGGGFAVMQGFKKLLQSSGAMSDAFEEHMQAAKSSVNFFFNALTTGNFDGFWSGLKKAASAGAEFARVMDELNDKRTALSFKEDAARVKYVEYMNIIRNVNKTEAQRKDAAEKLIAMEDDLLTKRSDINKKVYSETLKRIAAERGITEKQAEQFITQDKAFTTYMESAAERFNKNADKIRKQYINGGTESIIFYNRDIERLTKTDPMGAYASKTMKNLANITDAEREELKAAFNAISNDEVEFRQKTGKAQRVQDMLDANSNKDKIKDNKKTNDELLKQREEYLKLLEDLNKRAQSAELEGLTGIERIDKEEEISNKELDIFEKTLKSKGKITQEQADQLALIRKSIERKADLERTKFYQDEIIQENTKNVKVIDAQISNAEDQIDLTRYTEAEKLQLKIDAYKKGLMLLENIGGEEAEALTNSLKKSIAFAEKDLSEMPVSKNFSIWKTLGIDENSEEGKKQIDAINTFKDNFVSAIGEIMDAELELAQARTEQLENRLDELESALDTEKELQEQGLANNVSTVKAEIEQVKIEKQKALEEEKKIKKAQQTLETVQQVSSLVTSAAQIFESFSGLGPWGVPLAIAMIGVMLGSFTAAKIKASQAAKLEQGGFIDEYGVINGKRHNEGGEPLNKHVEVEAGEGIGVFNRSATSYYGGMLPKWVGSINKRQFPKFDIKPEIKANQIFDLKTHNMNSELKAIRNGIENLNQNILSQSQVNHTSWTRIEKQKNRTRIIHVKN